MVFSSGVFLYLFLPVFLAAYYALPRRASSLVIAFASYIFYGWWRPDFVGLMLFSTVVDFFCGRRIVAAQERGERGKTWLLVSMAVNLGLLGYFKYANFGVDSFNAIAANFGVGPLDWPKVVLPVGISFYTFQTMSYTIDVYRREATVVDRFSDFMCYVALFPQLVAGPIVRYSTVAEQLRHRSHTFAKFYQGVLCFQSGFVRKILIADTLGQVADPAFATEALPLVDAWTGLLAYTLQIYFDFSGYSDMAIGLGLMLGFRFPVNFNGPYRSTSITDFWRRWHISLSSWLRDYLYVPLGGNRKGNLRTYVNLMATMLLGGLWHGAAWTFVIWGAYQGIWLAAERAFGKRAFWFALPQPLQILATFVVAMFGWVPFRASSLDGCLTYLGSLFGGSPEGPLLEILPLHVGVLAIGMLVAWLPFTTQRLASRAPLTWVVVLQPLFLVALLQLQYQDHVPFLYYQF
ncbi:MAG: MBOAT family protein [Planctomycetota bacterium]